MFKLLLRHYYQNIYQTIEMTFKLCIIAVIFSAANLFAQNNKPTDYLSPQFHKEKRDAFRLKMPKNAVAVFFSNPLRNRANDVDFIFHQDPDYYYLTGYNEPNAVLVLFSEKQTLSDGTSTNEILYVQEKNARREQWTGIRLGVEGAKKELGFAVVKNGSDFLKAQITFGKFDTILFKEFQNDVRDEKSEAANLYQLISAFKAQIDFDKESNAQNDPAELKTVNPTTSTPVRKTKLDTKSMLNFMAAMREIKTDEEIKLITKAVRISAMGQREIMKAMHPGMSEMEVQGVHEYVYKKYGSEYEGYPSIVGAGNNGCVLHYIENTKLKVENDLVLMDLGAEYHGYTADVTRTIPANGKFSTEQQLIYDLVFQAQEAGIAAVQLGNSFNAPDAAARNVITEGLVRLGIAKSAMDARRFFPHGTSHHIGLDVHDPGTYQAFKPNMIVTVEPGIYIPIGSDCDKKWWGIAVRIEDDILTTTKGPINLSAEAPRSSSEIEKLMLEKSILDSFLLPKLD